MEQNNFTPKLMHILVESWPKTKKLSSVDAKKILNQEKLPAKSIEGEFVDGKCCVEFLLRDDPSPVLYVGLDSRNQEFLIRLIKSLTSNFNFSYGYLFGAPKPAAALYAVGITHGESADVSRADQEADSRWFAERVLPNSEHRYRDRGFFRDIYTCNLINRSHLNAVVDGMTLKDKIAIFDWGELIRVSDSNWLWSVKPSKIPEVRDAISRSNLFI